MGKPMYAKRDVDLFYGNERVFGGDIRDSEDPIVKQFPQCFSDDWHDSPHAHYTAPKPAVETTTAEPGEIREAQPVKKATKKAT